MVAGLVTMGVVGLLLGALLFRATSDISRSQITSTEQIPPTPLPTSTPTPEQVENVLGHLAYQEAPASELQAVTADGRIRLRQVAAKRFRQMQAAAKSTGVSLQVISGFRSVSEQNDLFFGVKQERNQDARKRAEVSAPPGYSEHHTGYAIDLGDGRVPAANLSRSFENTGAFRWLKNHANQYSFELSFPKNNSQGVSYEPWHWRFVGDQNSLETFYKARKLK
jgi:D-alanyl-D-alanine carboxypeptidase